MRKQLPLARNHLCLMLCKSYKCVMRASHYLADPDSIWFQYPYEVPLFVTESEPFWQDYYFASNEFEIFLPENFTTICIPNFASTIICEEELWEELISSCFL